MQAVLVVAALLACLTLGACFEGQPGPQGPPVDRPDKDRLAHKGHLAHKGQQGRGATEVRTHKVTVA